MNHYAMPSVIRMEPEVLKQLMTEVKETLATGIKMTEAKTSSFKAIDLWNIHRNKRSADSMRKMGYLK